MRARCSCSALQCQEPPKLDFSQHQCGLLGRECRGLKEYSWTDFCFLPRLYSFFAEHVKQRRCICPLCSFRCYRQELELMKQRSPKSLVTLLLLAVVLAGVAGAAWYALQPRGLGEGFASGNGRIEATEIDVATKLGGRIASIDVSEGDFVLPGQALARMDTEVLQAQLAQAEAQVRQAENAILTARALV